MTSLVQPARVLVDPFGALAPAVEARRWGLPLLLLVVSTSLAGTAFALRWEASSAVVRELQQSGQLAGMTESELTEEIQKKSRQALVGGIAQGVVLMPLLVLAVAVLLWLCGWLLDTHAPFSSLFTVAALALMPLALGQLVFAVCAAAQYSLTEQRALELVPSSLAALQGLSPKLQRVLRAVDFFRLWSFGLLGLGFAAATGRHWRLGLALAGVLFLMHVGLFYVGIPALTGSGR